MPHSPVSLASCARSIASCCRDGFAVGIGHPVRRLLVVADVAVTILAAAMLGLLILAKPAFRDTGPGWLRRLDLAVTFLDRQGKEIGRRGIRHRRSPGLTDLPPHLVDAVLATEDSRFFAHAGIDPVGFARALATNVRAGAVMQGGSTLTQQLAKNVFLSGERTLDRKVREAFLAVWLEWQLSKTEILQLYLDRAYMGAGTFGVEAAAQFYFGKTAREVTLPEAAMLAGLFKAPSRYAPHVSLAAARARAADVLDRMVETGRLSRNAAEVAKANPASATTREPDWHPDHYLDWAYRETLRLAATGRFDRDAILVVDTELDAPLQRRTERSAAAMLRDAGGRSRIGEAAVVVMDPGGGVHALLGGRNYEASQFNRATDAVRQPGSAFKPLVYATALAETGLRPFSTVLDEEICLGGWCPANYSRRFSGPVSLEGALANSLNTVAVRLSVEIGRAAGAVGSWSQARRGRGRVVAMARALGIRSALHDTPSLPLGASEVTPMELTAAFAAFANGGVRAEPFAVRRVRGGSGDVLYDRDREVAPPGRVLPSRVVGDMNRMLTRVVTSGTAGRAAIAGQVVAGKTGTTSAYRDAWFIGFTAHLVGAVWLGNDDGKPTREVTGGTLPATLWRTLMAPTLDGLPSTPLPGGDGGFEVADARGGRIVEVVPAAGGRRGFEVTGMPRSGFAVVR